MWHTIPGPEGNIDPYCLRKVIGNAESLRLRVTRSIALTQHLCFTASPVTAHAWLYVCKQIMSNDVG